MSRRDWYTPFPRWRIFCFVLILLLWCPTTTSFFVELIKARKHNSPALHISLPAEQDTRPHEQRAKGPRLAGRLNHGFRYLYRQSNTRFENMTSLEYLSQYYPEEEVYRMNQSFPPLLELNVSRHLHPKMRFLHETMGLSNISKSSIPPQYFGARLERIIAPRHAFLVFNELPHGRQLIDDPKTWRDFLLACRTTKRFCALCNQWRDKTLPMITSKQIEAFDTMFGRGVLAAARDAHCPSKNNWPLEHINITSAEILRLLIQHGANPLERDNRGITLLHWAAGTGNLEAVKELLPFFPKGVLELTERDGATPLHWSAAGANSKEFGTGGHTEVCRYLVSQCETPSSNVTTKQYVNRVTYDGNSPLMWASWSGTLDTVKTMIRNRADSKVANRNGCTVAHWASSGGNLQVCEYLGKVIGVDFFEPNHGGNTPLTHAVAFGRAEIVQWIREQAMGEDDEIAARLAEDFFVWTNGDAKRTQVLQLFQDDYWDDGVKDEDISISKAQELELEQY